MLDFICMGSVQLHTVQVFLSKSAKRFFYHTTVILQYWDKTIARSGDVYEDEKGILSLVIKYFGITNTSVQNFPVWFSCHKTAPKYLWKLNVLWTNVMYMHRLLISPLRAIVICQNYFRITVISFIILLFAPSLVMKRCVLWAGKNAMKAKKKKWWNKKWNKKNRTRTHNLWIRSLMLYWMSWSCIVEGKIEKVPRGIHYSRWKAE